MNDSLTMIRTYNNVLTAGIFIQLFCIINLLFLLIIGYKLLDMCMFLLFFSTLSLSVSSTVSAIKAIYIRNS